MAAIRTRASSRRRAGSGRAGIVDGVVRTVDAIEAVWAAGFGRAGVEFSVGGIVLAGV